MDELSNKKNYNNCLDELNYVRLCRRFSRLFDLSLNKSSTVAEMFSRGWGSSVELEETVVGMGGGVVRRVSFLLNNFVVQTDVIDRWQWLPDTVGGYTVCGAYQILTTRADYHY